MQWTVNPVLYDQAYAQLRDDLQVRDFLTVEHGPDGPVPKSSLIHRMWLTLGVADWLAYELASHEIVTLEAGAAYAAEHDPPAPRKKSPRQLEWEATRAKTRDEYRAARRPFEWLEYHFEDFGLGDELEHISTKRDAPTEELQGAIVDLVQECFRAMMQEGRWSFWMGDGFCWTDDPYAEFWGGGFPFTLDFKPCDVVEAVKSELGEYGRQANFADTLRAFRDAFDQAIALVEATPVNNEDEDEDEEA